MAVLPASPEFFVALRSMPVIVANIGFIAYCETI